jgi:uncharacterized protein YkwD
VTCLTAASAGAPALGAPIRHLDGQAQLRSRLLAGLNEVRSEHGLGQLRLATGLDQAAASHSAEMLADGYFGHGSADGQPFWERVEKFYPQPASGSWRVGENLLWIPGTISATQAIALWMSSPEHRANILAPGWQQVGIGIGAAGAPGIFGGRFVTVVTVDFGVRS